MRQSDSTRVGVCQDRPQKGSKAHGKYSTPAAALGLENDEVTRVDDAAKREHPNGLERANPELRDEEPPRNLSAATNHLEDVQLVLGERTTEVVAAMLGETTTALVHSDHSFSRSWMRSILSRRSRRSISAI